MPLPQARIEHAKLLQALDVAEEQPFRLVFRVLRAFSPAMVPAHQRHDAGLGCFPFALERFDHHRADELHDRARIGVVRAERGADFRVQAALEQRAENRRLDRAPVHVADFAQRLDLSGGHFHDIHLLEQSAVEPGDVLEQEVAANAHRAEHPGQ